MKWRVTCDQGHSFAYHTFPQDEPPKYVGYCPICDDKREQHCKVERSPEHLTLQNE